MTTGIATLSLHNPTRLSHLALSLCMLVTLCFTSPAEARNVPDNLADTVEKLMPAVVNISTSQKVSGHPGLLPEMMLPDMPPGSPLEEFRDFFERFRQYDDGFQMERKVYSLGSGFIVSPEGYIVTNNHVIADAEEITVRLNDERELDATIVGRDPKTDIALLKVEAGDDLPYVSFGNSDKARVGDWVIAIGNPFGLGGTVTVGIISARARDINAGPFDDFLQTDAAINTGNSGGPMFDLDGRVIGVNTAIFSPSGGNIGIGFATPAALAEPVVRQIKQHGRVRRAWLGVKIQTVTEDIAESLGLKDPKGALVVEITPGSPADVGGLYPGDVILSFNGEPVEEMRKFPRMVAETPIGETVALRVWRQGKMATASLTLGEAREPEVARQEGRDREPRATRSTPSSFMGMTLRPLDRDLREEMELPADENGLWVEDVARRSLAWERGLRPGDIISRVNETTVSTTTELKNLLNEARAAGRNYALLRIWREGGTQFITLPTAGE